MKFVNAVAILLFVAVAAVNAQVTVNNGTFSCFPGGGAYCAGDSLATNIIIRCNDKVGQAGNCNDNLAAAPPVGVKPFAPCYQSSPTAGDAACSWNCTAYPDTGLNFTLPTNVSSQCFVPGGQSSTPSNPTASANGTNLVISQTTTTLSATSSPTTSTTTLSATAIGVSMCGTDLCTATTTKATSTPISTPAAVTAMTANESSLLSVSPSSMSDLSAVFSSILAGAGNATVSVISAPASSLSVSAESSPGTVTITTTLANETIHLPTSSNAAGGPTGTASNAPAFTGGASSSNMAPRHMSSLWALLAMPALLFI